jgi:hypothetical protein
MSIASEAYFPLPTIACVVPRWLALATVSQFI